jgi:hypothetical protein
MMKIEQHIEEILIWFDFNQVKQMMDATNWKWALEENTDANGVPTVEAIKNPACKLIRHTYEEARVTTKGAFTCSCGGYTVKVDINENYCTLNFGIDWMTNEGDQYDR